MAGSCGSGTSVRSQPIRANSAEPALAVGLAELRLGMRGEELPRRARRPLLAHEQHRGERAGQHQHRGDRAGPRATSVRGQPVAGGPVADLVVVLQVRRRTARLGGPQRVDRPAVVAAAEAGAACRRGRSRRSAPWRALDMRAEVGVVARRSRRSARRAARGGSRRSTARRARSRRPPAAVISRGSLRSDSAISVSGRPRCGGQRVDLDGQLLEQVHRAVVDQRVHGVQPQPVDVVVAQPHQRVVDDVAAHLVGVAGRPG